MCWFISGLLTSVLTHSELQHVMACLVCLYHKAWFSVYSIWIPPTSVTKFVLFLSINETLLLGDTFLTDQTVVEGVQ